MTEETIKPEQIELSDKAPEIMSQEKIEEVAINDLNTYTPQLRSLLRLMSSKGKDRVITALILNPFQPTFSFQSQAEKECFGLMTHLLDCKMILLAKLLKEKEVKQTTSQSEESKDGEAAS